MNWVTSLTTTSRVRGALGLALGLALGGCQFQEASLQGQVIRCATDGGGEPCPTGFQCRAAIGRCVSDADLAKPPVGLANAHLGPALGNGTQPFTLTFEVTAPLFAAPRATAQAFSVDAQGAGHAVQVPLSCSACDPATPCECVLDVKALAGQPGGVGEGALPVSVQLVDALGNAPPPMDVGAVFLDLTPPGVTRVLDVRFTAPTEVSTPTTRLGEGAFVELCFGVDEPLSTPPQVFAADPAQPAAPALEFALSPGYPQGLRYCEQAALPADAAAHGLVDGPRTVFALLQDLAGNQATVALLGAVTDAGAPGDDALVIDTTPPPAPASDVGGLRQRRAPWGEAPDIGTPRFGLTVPAGAVAEPGWVVAYADAERLAEVGRAHVSPSDLAQIVLAPIDAPRLYVDLVDEAGNRNAAGPVVVRNVDWVASLGLKQGPDRRVNPHSCLGRTVASGRLVQGDDAANEQDRQSGPVGGAWTDGGARGPVLTPAATWVHREAGAPQLYELDDFDPTFRRDVAVTYDPATQRLWALGTYNGSLLVDEDGQDWHLHDGLQTSPSERDGHAFAFDRTRGAAVLFGGRGSTNAALCDTWEWSGQAWSRRAACTSDDGLTGPPTRSNAALVYDPLRRRTVLFSGRGAVRTTLLADAWSWDGTAWSALDVSGTHAVPARAEGGIAFEAEPDGGGALVWSAGRALAAGAEQDSDETWVGRWDGTGYAWQRESGATPCSAAAGASACGPVKATGLPDGAPVVQAGLSAGAWHLLRHQPAAARWQDLGAVPGDVMTWGLGPSPARAGDPGPAVLVYGQTPGGAIDPDPASWRCVLTTTVECIKEHQGLFPPARRFAAGLAFDDKGAAVLLGGTSGDLFNAYDVDDTDLWSGVDWRDGPTGPGARAHPALAYFPDAGAVWAFGGDHFSTTATLSDLWAFKGGAWSRVATSPLGAGWAQPHLAYATWQGNSGLLAVQPGKDTQLLTWDGAQVGVVRVAGAPPAGALAVDVARQVAVISRESDGQLFELDLTQAAPTWTSVSTAAAPSHAFVGYDPVLGQTLLVGTVTQDPLDGDAWTWDGSHLRRLLFADPEGDGQRPQLDDPAVALDPVSRSVLSFGGLTPSADNSNHTWQLRYADTTASEVCQWRFNAAGAPAGTPLQGVTLQADASAATAVHLRLWQGGAWTEVARCPAGAPCHLEATVHDADVLTHLLDDLGTLGVELAPAAADDRTPLQVGRVQAVFSYRL